MKHTIHSSSDTSVKKFVFVGEDIAVEAVVYKYPTYKERTVICCSTQCGCPVGCNFCGTGKFFKRNLTVDEITEQIETILSTIDCDPLEIEKFQIMFMSMGEPMLNLESVMSAIEVLHEKYPNAQLLISTSAPEIDMEKYVHFIENCAAKIDKVGMQFSVHESTDENRKKLIPSRSMSLANIGKIGEYFAKVTNRKPYFNYCVHENNSSQEDINNLIEYFNQDVWECTLSVICEKDESVSSSIQRQLELINKFQESMVESGYSIRVFNPSGQDDIGGGCGQLWFFQEWAKKNKLNK